VSIEGLAQVLADHPFFYDMRPDHLETLAGCASVAEFTPGRKIFKEGGDADACYLIVEGDVALEITLPRLGQHVVTTLHGGDVLGWSWLFPPYRWSFDAQALTGVKTIRFDAAELREKKAEDPVLGYELMQRFAEVLVERMQATRLQLLDVYGSSR
jgi:CRP-like cAMP-binding protein